jgi:hypothetical protein
MRENQWFSFDASPGLAGDLPQFAMLMAVGIANSQCSGVFQMAARFSGGGACFYAFGRLVAKWPVGG